MLEILILSFIQGVTEFLPVSSSSHLIIFSNYVNFEEQSLSIDVSLHIGSFFAVVFYFRKELINFIENKNLLFKVLISSVPIMIVGYFLVKTNYIEELRNFKIIGWTTLIFGILLYVSDKFKLDKNINQNFDLKSVVFLGFMQVLSLVPGVSRSGITITAARMLNFNRLDAAKISFLLSIPTLAVVSAYGIKNIIFSENLNFSYLNILSILLSFIFSFFTIKYFLNFIRKTDLKIFVIYRIILGILLIIYAYL